MKLVYVQASQQMKFLSNPLEHDEENSIFCVKKSPLKMEINFIRIFLCSSPCTVIQSFSCCVCILF